VPSLRDRIILVNYQRVERIVLRNFIFSRSASPDRIISVYTRIFLSICFGVCLPFVKDGIMGL